MSKKPESESAVPKAVAPKRVHISEVRSQGGTFTTDKDGYVLNHVPSTKDGTRAGDPLADIKRAIRDLDRNDPSLWTDQGVPRVDAIEAALGLEITKSQRDSAWAQVKE